MSGRIDPTQAAKTLAEALGRTTDTGARSSSWTLMGMMGGHKAGPALASVLSGVANRMDPTEAARVCGQAAKTLAEALGRETDFYARSSLATLSTFAARMDRAEAARVCGPVVHFSVQKPLARAPAGGQIARLEQAAGQAA